MASTDSENSKTILTASELRDRDLYVPQYSTKPDFSDFGLSSSDLEKLEEEEQKRVLANDDQPKKVACGLVVASAVVCFFIGLSRWGVVGGVALAAFGAFCFSWLIQIVFYHSLEKEENPRFRSVLQYKAAVTHWEYWEQRRHQQEQRQTQHQEEQRQKQEQQRRRQEEQRKKQEQQRQRQEREYSHRSQNRDKQHPVTANSLDWCYTMLGVSSTAAMDEIRKAYHKKAKLHHPDRGGDPDAMITLNRAFELIEESRGES